MSEQIHDQVSAFVDDELSPEECAFLARRLERDAETRAKFVRYSLIGSAMRGELLQPDPGILRRRVQEALSGSAPARSPAASAPPARAAAASHWANPAVGLGIAASVAVAALFAIRTVNENDLPQAPLVAPASVAAAASGSASPSYVVPADTEDSRVVGPLPIRLTNYLLHHGEYARLSRTSVHSNVVTNVDAPLVVEPAVRDDVPSSNGREAR